MIKMLTDKEMVEVIRLAVHDDLIDCQDQYLHFLEDLGKLIGDHFGGTLSRISSPYNGTDACEYYGHFAWNECVPDDGGIFKNFDKDCSVVDWRG